jgi:hypothetical protein
MPKAFSGNLYSTLENKNVMNVGRCLSKRYILKNTSKLTMKNYRFNECGKIFHQN